VVNIGYWLFFYLGYWWLILVIGCIFIWAIGGYYWLLVPILLVDINGYFINGYSISGYW
jgi:hypothetical protein